jgi:hypothetical protein
MSNVGGVMRRALSPVTIAIAVLLICGFAGRAGATYSLDLDFANGSVFVGAVPGGGVVTEVKSNSWAIGGNSINGGVLDFGSGGAFSLSGTCLGYQGTLLSGRFTVESAFSTPGMFTVTLSLDKASLTDAFARLLGVSSTDWNGYLTFVFNRKSGSWSGGGFGLIESVPAPSTLLLLGPALLGLVGIRKRLSSGKRT